MRDFVVGRIGPADAFIMGRISEQCHLVRRGDIVPRLGHRFSSDCRL